MNPQRAPDPARTNTIAAHWEQERARSASSLLAKRFGHDKPDLQAPLRSLPLAARSDHVGTRAGLWAGPFQSGGPAHEPLSHRTKIEDSRGMASYQAAAEYERERVYPYELAETFGIAMWNRRP